MENSKKFQTVETPNVLGIYLLATVLKDFLKIGLKTIRKQTDEKSKMLYSFFSKPEYYTAFVNLREYRSITTPVFEITGRSESIRKFAAQKGLILGAGYSGFKNQHLRIGKFPARPESDIKKLIQVLNRFKLK